jgi:hypothetical protein
MVGDRNSKCTLPWIFKNKKIKEGNLPNVKL